MDSLDHAVEMLAASESGAVPVLADGALCGLVSDREIAIGLTQPAPVCVGDVMTRSAPIVPASTLASEALTILAHTEFPAIPVATMDGRFIGTVSRSELLKAMFQRRRPKQVGGMATPLGVYLSDGNVRGGAGDWGLFLTGVFLFFGSLFAGIAAFGAAYAWHKYGLPQLISTDWIQAGASIVAFALWFRLSWIAGYHAAEHQTVHALERNDPLTPERVAMMPRPHPRCGTNIVVLFSLFCTLVWQLRIDPLVAGVFSLVVYKFLGQWVQQHITTRRATLGQLRSGIHAAEQLLERFQSGTAPARFPAVSRIWNMGFAQVAMGYYLIPMILFFLATRHVHFVGWLSRYLQ
jgi:hypothetical protein